MAFGKVLRNPGINTEFTTTLNAAGWSQSQLMRWRMGLPEKLGGWQALFTTPVVGTGLGMHSWADLGGNAYLMIGTDQRLEVGSQGALYDITPLRLTTNNAVAFSTTNGSTLVKITDAGSAATAGDWIYIVVPVSVGGLILQGFYIVADAIDAVNYHINAATPATATVGPAGAVPVFDTTNTSATVKVTLANHGLITGAPFEVEVSTTGGGVTLLGTYTVTVLTANTFNIVASGVATGTTTFSENGGNARIYYLIPSGLAQNTAETGYGVGDYGADDYGLSGTGTTIVPMRQWTGDNWGQDLVCCYTGGPIYQWSPPPTGVLPGNRVGNPATVIANSPTQNTTLFVFSQAEILVACGCEASGTFDPLLVRWCDQDNLTVWIAASGNQAGRYRLKSGSRIVGGLVTAQGALIWTDVSVWVMQYVGYPEVFGFLEVGRNCGLIAMRAVGVLNSAVWWMGRDNFYVSSPGGTPTPLPCTVWDKVFRNLNSLQLEAIHCAINPLFNEVSWFYPSANSASIDSYVKYNTVEQTWDYGILDRTCWDEGLVFGAPVGCDETSLIQQHETSPDANGQPLAYSFTTGYFDIGNGDDFFRVDQLLPDFVQTTTAQVQITVFTRDGPNSPVRTYGPYTYNGISNPQANIIALNARGRQMAIQFSGNDLGSFMRLGGTRYRYGSAGGR